MRKFRKTMALLLVLAMVLTTFGAVTVSAASFSDTQGHWAESVIDKWSSAGVVNGYSDGTFHPDSNITRAELAKVISTARKFATEADINFSDVAADDWFVSDLKKCVAQGVIGGYEDGTFRPDNEVTREEAAAMFQRAYQINSHGLITFADSDQISAWATTAISSMVGTGVINGYDDNTFRPAASITRAEVVKILDGITAIGSEPGATTAPGQNEVSSGTVVNSGLGGSGSGGGYFGGGLGGSGSSSGNGNTGYPVTFNANGGKFDNGSATKTVTIARNSVIGGAEPAVTREEVSEEPAPEASAEPEITTYSFAGWYKSKQAADELDDSQKWDIDNDRVLGGTTLYAGWYKDGDVYVGFELNGGKVIDATTVNPQTIASGGYASEPKEAPTREHYTFEGWYASNSASSKFNFAGTPIKKNTTIYAKWSIDPEYAANEITMPDTTVGSSQNGTITAAPVSALPGEQIALTVKAPAGFKVRDLKKLSYISTITGEKKDVSSAVCKNGVVTFTLPQDVVNGTMEVEIYFTADRTDKPVETAPPAEGESPGVISYNFSDEQYEQYRNTNMKANVDYDGFTISKDAKLDPSDKSFSTTQKNYAWTLKVGTGVFTLNLYGPCKISIDAVSASGSEKRAYDVYDGSGKLLVENFECIGGASPTCVFEYEGDATNSIQIKPRAGINFYGIICDYGPDFVRPTPTPAPTPDPSVKHKISAAVTGNGTVAASAEQEVKGQKITISAKPDAGYKVAGIITDPIVNVTDEGSGNYSFSMPYADINVTARIVPETAEARQVMLGDSPNGTVTLTPSASYITAPVVNTDEDFLAYKGGDGAWAVTQEGVVPADGVGDPSTVEVSDEVRGNKTNKILVSDQGVSYALSEPVEGPFTLSYDMLITGGIKQAFRTYMDNAADSVDPATGKVTSGGNDNAFFHMTNLNDRIYVSREATDLAVTDSKNAKGSVMLSKNETEDNRWYKVIVKGNTNDKTVSVEYYKHSANGNYSANSTVAEPEITSTAAPFVNGRKASIKQIRLERATSGSVYYDNVKLVRYNDTQYSAYDGEEFTVSAAADLGYELREIVLTDAAGNKTNIDFTADTSSGGTAKFKVPSYDVTVSAVFGSEQPADIPPELTDITGDYEFAASDYITGSQKPAIYVDNNKVYLSGNHKYNANEKGSNEIGSLGKKYNVLCLTGKTSYVAFRPSFDAEITVYCEENSGRTIGAGVKPGSCSLYLGKVNTAVHTFTVKAGTCVFVTGVNTKGAASELYLGGFTVKHASSAAAAEAEDQESVVIDADAIVAESAEAEAEETAEIVEDNEQEAVETVDEADEALSEADIETQAE